MKEARVRIAELKARLSHFLRAVRKGSPLTVLDRETPVARLVPYRENKKDIMSIRPATKRPDQIRPPKPAVRKMDVLKALHEERADRL